MEYHAKVSVFKKNFIKKYFSHSSHDIAKIEEFLEEYTTVQLLRSFFVFLRFEGFFLQTFDKVMIKKQTQSGQKYN